MVEVLREGWGRTIFDIPILPSYILTKSKVNYEFLYKYFFFPLYKETIIPVLRPAHCGGEPCVI